MEHASMYEIEVMVPMKSITTIKSNENLSLLQWCIRTKIWFNSILIITM